MRSTLATAIAGAAFLLAGMVRGETLHNGKVYQTTADRLITARRLVCVYGQWQSITLANGATVLTRSKVCK